jgi:hypothetical protein
MTQRGDLDDTRWPADDPWWRFTPRNLAVGYLSLFAALICLGWSVLSLLDGGLTTAYTVFFIALVVVSLLWLVQTTNGLKVLLRRRSRHQADGPPPS